MSNTEGVVRFLAVEIANKSGTVSTIANAGKDILILQQTKPSDKNIYTESGTILSSISALSSLSGNIGSKASPIIRALSDTAFALSDYKQNDGQITDRTIISLIGNVSGMAVLAASTPVTAVIFTTAAIGLGMYSLIMAIRISLKQSPDSAAVSLSE